MHRRSQSGLFVSLILAMTHAACLASGGSIQSAGLNAEGDDASLGGTVSTGMGGTAAGNGNMAAADANAQNSNLPASANNTTTPAQASAGGPPAASRGATVPYWEYEAESAKTNGTVLPVSRTFGEIANEASGRSAVRLSNTGEYVQFTLEHPANSIVVRYSMPDAPGGGGMQATLGLYVGSKRMPLAVTSRYSWTYGDQDAQDLGSETPSSTTPHHYFDETHVMFDTMPAGTVIKVQKDSQDTAAWYVVDLVDFELVAAPASQPDGSLSVMDFGATPDDGSDDHAAFQKAFDAGRAQKKVVWIPKGVFNMSPYDGKGNQTKKLVAQETTIMGAGMWHSVILGFSGMIEVSGNNNKFSDFALFGDVTYRNDSGGWQGFNGPAGTGSSITNVWIEHVTAGWWVGKGAYPGQVTMPLTDGLKVTGLRVRNTWADGINLANATANSVVSQCTFRNTGDDGMATWSFSGDGPLPCKNNIFKFNTVVAPWRASCMAVYGGQDNVFADNVCLDTSNYPGLTLSTGFSAIPFAGTTMAARNSFIRAGGPHYGQQFGALRFFADSQPLSGIAVSDCDIDSPTFSGIHFGGGRAMSQIIIDKVTVKNPGTQGIWATSECQGGVTLSNVTVSGATVGLKNDTNNFIISKGAGNVGF